MHKCENMDHYEAWEEKASLLKIISSNALLEKKANDYITLNNFIKTINRLNKLSKLLLSWIYIWVVNLTCLSTTIH